MHAARAQHLILVIMGAAFMPGGAVFAGDLICGMPMDYSYKGDELP